MTCRGVQLSIMFPNIIKIDLLSYHFVYLCFSVVISQIFHVEAASISKLFNILKNPLFSEEQLIGSYVADRKRNY